jgi:uncharacterized protein DUF1553/uncharacterized protein DUF1549
MKQSLILLFILLIFLSDSSAQQRIVRPFEVSVPFISNNQIDDIVLASFKQNNIQPAPLCSDEVFIRRVFLDVIGSLPTSQETQRFFKDHGSNKRAFLIDYLLQREEFVDYWSLKWGDLLRVKSEFPINLWPNAVQAYNRWIHDSLSHNKPYNQFARELLTSSGSNFRTPAINFYRAIQGQDPSAIAAAVGLTFMGVRTENWPLKQRNGMEAFFSKVAYKKTAEWKEEIVYFDPTPSSPFEAIFPDGVKVTIASGEDPRHVFADWLITPDNPWFTRNIVNRVWAWLLGRGIIHEPDNIQPDASPALPELLTYLENKLIETKYDLRNLYRLILNSRIYQQSSIHPDAHPETENHCAFYHVRRLEAEVLIDAINQIFGEKESYSSAIPEPFTFIPEHHRTIELTDGSITSQFLEMFGRPSRDTGLESERNNQSSNAQRLHLLNSTHIQNKIDKSRRLKALLKNSKKDNRYIIKGIYFDILTRFPMPSELSKAEQYFRTGEVSQKQAAVDLAWALINTKEFSYRH